MHKILMVNYEINNTVIVHLTIQNKTNQFCYGSRIIMNVQQCHNVIEALERVNSRGKIKMRFKKLNQDKENS